MGSLRQFYKLGYAVSLDVRAAIVILGAASLRKVTRRLPDDVEDSMSAAHMKRRLKKLEQRSSVQHDGLFTLEELCRSIWLSDKNHFLELARQQTRLSLFVAQFELDETEGGRNEMRAQSQRTR